MTLTLHDYERKTRATTAPYATIALQPDGTPLFAGADVKRAQKCFGNAREAVILAGNRTPTAAQVLTWLAAKSPKAKNGRITVES